MDEKWYLWIFWHPYCRGLPSGISPSRFLKTTVGFTDEGQIGRECMLSLYSKHRILKQCISCWSVIGLLYYSETMQTTRTFYSNVYLTYPNRKYLHARNLGLEYQRYWSSMMLHDAYHLAYWMKPYVMKNLRENLSSLHLYISSWFLKIVRLPRSTLNVQLIILLFL